jgi:beta-glucanase (GH16 family)
MESPVALPIEHPLGQDRFFDRHPLLARAVAIGLTVSTLALSACTRSGGEVDAAPRTSASPEAAVELCIDATPGETAPGRSEFSASPSWEQNFCEQPNGPVNESIWTYDDNPEVPGYNDERQGYSRNNVEVRDGQLVITARNEKFSYDNDDREFDYTSGRIDTRNSLKFQYGKIEAEMMMPTGAGAWPAFWLLSATQPHTDLIPNKTWDDGTFYKRDSETDVEYYGNKPGQIEATVHTFDRTTEGHVSVPDAETAFHVYGIEVTPTEIRWTVDGQLYHSYKKTSDKTTSWPFQQNREGEPNELYVILNLAMGGSGGGEIDDSKGPWDLAIKRVSFYDYQAAGSQ